MKSTSKFLILGSFLVLQTSCGLKSEVKSKDDASTGTLAEGSIANGGNSFGTIATVGTNDSNAFTIETNGAERMRFDTSGNVGVGTTTPAYKFDVAGAVNGTSICIAGDCKTSWPAGTGTVTSSGSSAGYLSKFTTATNVTNSGLYEIAGLIGLNSTSPNSHFEIADTATVATRGLAVSQFTTDGAAPVINLMKARGTQAAPATIQNGDYLGSINTKVFGTTFVSGHAGIGFVTNGAVVGDTVPVDTIFWNNTAGTTNPYTDGSTKMVLTSGGKLGVGTTTPTSKLTVSSNTAIQAVPVDTYEHYVGADANVHRVIYDGHGGNTALTLRRANGTAAAPTAILANEQLGNISVRGHDGAAYTSNTAAIGMFASENYTAATMGTFINFYTTTTGTTSLAERMRLDSAGNLGIGTTTPYTQLDVVSSVNTYPRGIMTTSYFAGQATNLITGRKARGTEAVPTAVLDEDTLASFGGAGYGATAWSTMQRARVGMRAAENWTDAAQGASVIFDTVANGGTSLVERMRVDHDGQVGIGTTDPQYLFHVYTATVGATVANFQSGTGSCTITPNAGMSCVSDIRLKENIEVIPDALSKVLKLRGVTFDWKGQMNSHSMGFVAQEVEVIAPELVRESHNGFKQVNYANFVAVLVEAIKELYHKWLSDSESLHQQDKEQARKIAALEIENQKLKSRLDQQNTELQKIKQKLGLK